MMIFHLKESLNLLLNHFAYVLRHDFAFKILKQLLYHLLFLIFLIREMLFERFINLFKLFLRFGLILLEVVLLL